jgi:hypothetical protein
VPAAETANQQSQYEGNNEDSTAKEQTFIHHSAGDLKEEVRLALKPVT